MMRRMFGRVPEAVEVAWHNTAVFKDMMLFGQKTEKWKELDANVATYAHMATAVLVGCSKSSGAVRQIAHRALSAWLRGVLGSR